MSNITRVLIVEDEKDHQEIFIELVEDLGFNYQLAESLTESIEILNWFSFHVALVDLRLDSDDNNNQDGFKALKYINDLDEGTETIMLTAFGEVPEANIAFSDHKVFRFIKKTKMDVNEIYKIIQEAAIKSRLNMSEIRRQPPSILQIMKGSADVIPQFTEKEKYEELDELLKRMLREFHPILPEKQDVKLDDFWGKEKSVQTRFWSKALGKPVAAWFGEFEAMKKAIGDIDKSPAMMKQLGFEKMIKATFDKSSIPYFGGAVFEVGHVCRDEFLSKR
jgi:CheY-like chemotaxis protein